MSMSSIFGHSSAAAGGGGADHHNNNGSERRRLDMFNMMNGDRQFNQKISNLQVICTSMKQATKIGDKKKAADQLTTLLDNDDKLLKILDHCSCLHTNKNNSQKWEFTWTTLFREAETFFEKESDKLQEGHINDNKKIYYYQVIDKIIEKANSSRPHIQKDIFYNFIIKKLHHKTILYVFGNSLFMVLQRFLKFKEYVDTMNNQEWNDLITLLLDLYSGHNRHLIQKSNILETLNTAIGRGSNYPQNLSLLKKDVLRFYTHSLKAEADKNFGSFLKGFTLLCQENALEFRDLLCKAGEEIIPKILNENLTIKEDESLIIEMLLVQMRIHSPGDVYGNSPAFYAHDNSTWIDLIGLIFTYCIDFIESFAKDVDKQATSLKGVSIIRELKNNLLQLVVKCTKQICNISLIEGDDFSRPAKKKMTHRSFQSIIDDVLLMNTSEVKIVWLTYLTAVFDDDPSLIGSAKNFNNLFEIRNSLSGTNYFGRNEISSFFNSLLYCEKYLISKGVIKEMNSNWKFIWESTIKTFSLKVYLPSGMELMRNLIREKVPVNLNSLLTIFVNGSIQLGDESLKLLGEYLSQCSLPSLTENSSNSRKIICKWLLSSIDRNLSVTVAKSTSLMSSIFVSLLIKRSHMVFQVVSTDFQIKVPFRVTTEDFELDMIKFSFVKLPEHLHKKDFENTAASTPPEDFNRKDKDIGDCTLLNDISEKVIELLSQDLERLPKFEERRINSSEFLKRIFHVQFRLELYLKFIHCLNQFKIEGEVGSLKSKLEKSFETLMNHYQKGILDFLKQNQGEQRVDNIYPLVQYIKSLLNCQMLSDNIKSLLFFKFSPEIVEFLQKVFKSCLLKNSNTHEEFGYFTLQSPSIGRGLFASPQKEPQFRNSEDELSEIRKCELTCVEALLGLFDYGAGGNLGLIYFTEIINELFEEFQFIPNLFLFEMSVEFLKKAISLVYYSLDLFNPTLKLLQVMCKYYYSKPGCGLALWNLFGRLAPLMPMLVERDENLVKKYMILVGNLFGILTTNVYVKSSKEAFKCLSVIAEHDPNLTWSWFSPNHKKDPNAALVYINLETCSFLQNSSHQVKHYVVDLIYSVFLHAAPNIPAPGENKSSSFKKINLFYEDIANKLQERLKMHDSCSDEETIEELKFRTKIALYCLIKLIVANPYIQKKALVNVFCLHKRLDGSLTNSALKFIDPNMEKTMSYHILYLLEKWIKCFDIKAFPYQFLECESLDAFYNKYRKEIVIQFFEQFKIDELNSFSESIKISKADLVKECFGMIITRIGPNLISTTPSRNLDFFGLSESNSKLKLLLEILGGKKVAESLITSQIEDIVLQLISLVYDQNITSKWNCPKIHLPSPEQPNYQEETVNRYLEFLKETSSHKEVSIIGFLGKNSPKAIYKILLTLVLRIHNAHDKLEQFWRLHHFSFFVNLLLQEPPLIVKNIKVFSIQFITYSFLRLFSAFEEQDFQQATLSVFSSYIKSLCTVAPSELNYHFKPIIYRLIEVSVSSKDGILIENVKEILDHLILENGDKFSNSIASLDPFPENIEQFKIYTQHLNRVKYGENVNTSWPLSKELTHILSEANAGIMTNKITIEKLKFIKKLLSERKDELKEMVKNLEEKSFSNHASNDVFHSLMQMLLEIATSSKDFENALEASRCLGEIGPINLSIMVLPSYGHKSRLTKMSNALFVITEIIESYLTSDDINIVKVSSDVLESIMQVNECIEVSKEYLKTKPRLNALLDPFKSTNNSNGKSTAKVDVAKLELKLDIDGRIEFLDFSTWITTFCCELIDCISPIDNFSHRIKPLCKISVEFCREIFPFLFYVLLYAGKTNQSTRKLLSIYMRNFFEKFKSLSKNSGSNRTSIYLNKLAIFNLLNVIQFLRTHKALHYDEKINLTSWDNNFWLELNYLDLAKAAQYCGAYLTSILYTDIFSSDSENLDNSPEENEYTLMCYTQQDTTCYPKNKIEATKIEKIFLKAYTSIGDPDAIYGCGSARFSDFESNIHHHQQAKQWERVLALYNTNQSKQREIGICTSLKELGLTDVLWTYLVGIGSTGEPLEYDLTEVQFEVGWRLSKWNINCDKPSYIYDYPKGDGNSHSVPAFHKYIYESIQYGMSNDYLSFQDSLKMGLKIILNDLKQASLESSENLYNFLVRFQMFRLIEDFLHKNTPEAVDSILIKWKKQSSIAYGDFKYEESLLELKNVLVQTHEEKHFSYHIQECYDECILELLSKAREAGRMDIAEKCTSRIFSSDLKIRKDIEIAKNHWKRGEFDIAKHMMNRLIRKNSNDESCKFYPSMLLLQGQWLAQTMSESPNVILAKYLLASCIMYDENISQSDIQEVANANIVLARYSDEQYQNIGKYIKSEIFQEKVKQYDRAQNELKNSTRVSDQSEDVKRSALLIRKQSSIDHNEIQTTYNEKKKFLVLALRHYFRGLNKCDDHDLLIFRAMSLWLENTEEGPQQLGSSEVNKIVSEENLPSYKYIVVLHQLTARLNNDRPVVNDLLNKILATCAKDHPYHTLPIILTQSLLNKDISKANSKKQVDDRVKAAGKLVDKLKKEPKLKTLVLKMDKLWCELISFANYQDKGKNQTGPKQIPANNQLKLIKTFQDVPVPTYNFPVSKSGQYEGLLIGIDRFEQTYHFVGGINSPKKISCHGTNGVLFNMLLKGNDDIRQDAVMQQVFGVMNKLLKEEANTKSRRLQIRTYKCVPLSQTTGILEWCENTQTFGEYLVGNEKSSGAHATYRPDDFKPMECRIKLNNVRNCGENSKKLEIFNNIVENFKPVFRHFFFENFKDAGIYFERRLAYTRSVATSSMVGHILGLGDRHVMNILVDKETAEFIHIDLGVAFEQGKILPCPETIPFRLTRDVVDGMGVSGVEGVFRRSCEMTLEVLRNNTEIILTILEVLLYDPLYMWTLTADRMEKVQPGDKQPVRRKSMAAEEENNNKERNNSAVRALLRLKQKLLGIEEGSSSGSSLSVPGHVSLLIQQSMDVERYSRLFPGWQAYL